MDERLYILDAHSLIYQVFHGMPEMTAPNGMPTNAVFGFVRDIQTIRREKRPDYLICAFDADGATFRHELSADYKATRKAMPDDLKPQIPMIFKILEAFRIPVLAQTGVEADDIMASVAVEGCKRKIHTYLCTADKDMRQLVNECVFVYDLRRNRLIDRDFVINDWGITPEQVIDYQAMVGDSIDNIKGIPGVGPKTASQLLKSYGTLEDIYEHSGEIKGQKTRENFHKFREAVFLSRQLVRLKTDVPLPNDWNIWRPQVPDRDKLLALFGECGFHRVADEIREELKTLAPAPSGWKADYQTVREPWDFDNLLHEMSRLTHISVDLETTSRDPMRGQIVGFALAWEPGKAYYLPVCGPQGEECLPAAEVIEKLRPILENPEIEKVGQNLKFDMVALRNAGVNLQGLAIDTMVASYLLESGERNHSLDELSRRFLGHEMIPIRDILPPGEINKLEARMQDVPLARMTEYAAEDADVALRLSEILAPKLREQALENLFSELEIPLVEVLAEMEFTGIRIDPERLADMQSEFSARLDEIASEVFLAAGHEFNLDSPTQLRTVLFDELKLPVIKRTKSGPSTDQEVLEELADRHPVCMLLLEHRRLAKLKSTYLEALPGLIHPRTGRIHASFNQTVAATGRLSSSDPNLQNIPVRTEEGKQIRQAFLPGNENQVLLSADYSQIELRLLAHFSGDPTLKQAFIDDKDIHAVVAAQISGAAEGASSSEWRRRAKTVNFGIMYGLSAFGLARRLKIDRHEAAQFIDAYFAQYPSIDLLFTKILESAQKKGYVTTILGRRRAISGIKNTTGRSRNLPERTAINTVIQGSAADLIKKAMVEIHRRLESGDFAAKMLLQIHDELVFEVDRDQVQPLAQMVNEEMTSALQLDIPLKVDIGIGPNWLDLEPLEVTKPVRPRRERLAKK